MKLEVIGFNLCNVDTGQLLAHSVSDFDFGIDEHRKKLHRMLDVFIDQCISHNTYPGHDTFCLEFRSYREQKDLELPF